MPTLQDRVTEEMKAAMLARDSERLSTLRLLKSALGYAQIERKSDNLTDSDVIGIIQREIKKRNDSIEQYEKAGRLELAEKEKKEITILETFLPRPLTAEELEQLVQSTINELGAKGKKEMGPVIKAVQSKAAGRADGKTISTVVGKFLS